MATIYGLASFYTNKIYIGITGGKIAKRFREHRCLLRNAKHFESGLQEDWNMFGEDGFYIFPLQELQPDATVRDKINAELGWMDRYTDRLYNSRRMSIHQSSLGTKQSAETKLKRRMAQLGIPKGHGAKISATKRRKRLADIVCSNAE